MIYARQWMDAFASQPSGVTARLPTLQDFSIELNCETPFHANEYNDCRQAGCNASAAMFSIPHEQKKRRSIAHGAVYLTKLSSKWRQELTQSIAPQMPYWVLLQVLPAAWGGDCDKSYDVVRLVWMIGLKHWAVVQLIMQAFPTVSPSQSKSSCDSIQTTSNLSVMATYGHYSEAYHILLIQAHQCGRKVCRLHDSSGERNCLSLSKVITGYVVAPKSNFSSSCSSLRYIFNMAFLGSPSGQPLCHQQNSTDVANSVAALGTKTLAPVAFRAI